MIDAFEIEILAAVAAHQRQPFIAIIIISDAGSAEIGALVTVTEIFHQHDIVAATSVERMDQITTDEAGAAGDDNHGSTSRLLMRSTSAVVEKPSWKLTVVTRPPAALTAAAPAIASV